MSDLVLNLVLGLVTDTLRLLPPPQDSEFFDLVTDGQRHIQTELQTDRDTDKEISVFISVCLSQT